MPESLREISETYNELFLHGFSTLENFNTRHKNPYAEISQDRSWKTQLQVLLHRRPTISAYSLNESCDERHMWSGAGVILNGGLLLAGVPGDMHTGTDGIDRTFRAEYATRENIIKALYRSRGDYITIRHNEFVVQDPEIFGFYYCRDSLWPGDPGYVGFEDVVRGLRDLECEMPVYVVKKGVAHSAKIKEAVGITYQKDSLVPLSARDIATTETRRYTARELPQQATA